MAVLKLREAGRLGTDVWCGSGGLRRGDKVKSQVEQLIERGAGMEFRVRV